MGAVLKKCPCSRGVPPPCFPLPPGGLRKELVPNVCSGEQVCELQPVSVHRQGSPENLIWESLCEPGRAHSAVSLKLHHICPLSRRGFSEPRDALAAPGQCWFRKQNRCWCLAVPHGPQPCVRCPTEPSKPPAEAGGHDSHVPDKETEAPGVSKRSVAHLEGEGEVVTLSRGLSRTWALSHHHLPHLS